MAIAEELFQIVISVKLLAEKCEESEYIGVVAA